MGCQQKKNLKNMKKGKKMGKKKNLLKKQKAR
jgi:hypothetical protein